MSPVVRGHLQPPGNAPQLGERVDPLARISGDVRVEQILSGELEAPADFLQDHDEWVVVLSGRAALDVAGEQLDLFAGDWIVLPADVPHRVLRTQPGTSWLAVHGQPHG